MLYPNIKRTGNVKAQCEFINNAVNVKITRHFDKHKFHKMVAVMRSDPAFEKFTDGQVYKYLDCIKIESADLVDEDAVDYDIFGDELTDAKHNISIHHRYIQTELNPDCLTLKEAVAKGTHIENECWINTLMEHYANTLMRHKRTKKNNLTRERILEIINKSDEDFKKHGASINQMNAVFKQFNIKARIYDIDSKLIYKHDPKDYDSRTLITFNGLVKNSHIYTLNHDLKSLKKKQL